MLIPKAMEKVRISTSQSYVELEAVEGISVADALQSAIDFCKKYELKDCTLNYKGFLFDIEPGYRVEDKLKDWNDHLEYKKKSAKCSSPEREFWA